VTDNPEQLIYKRTIAEGSVSHTPLHKSLSFPGKPVTFQNLNSDPFSQQSLVKTRFDSFVTEIFFDPTVLQPQTLEVLSPTAKRKITHSVLPSPSSSSSSAVTSPIIQPTIPPPPHIMAARYAPLVLAAPLHAMPQDYQTRLPQFDATGPLSAQQHVDKMNDYFDLHEVDEADIQMRLFSQSLTGDVKKWYKGLFAAFVLDLTTFQRSFLDRWEVKNNPLQILSEYESIKRNQGETVQDYCTHFNNLYNTILAEIKPPQGLALIKFPDGFDADMSYQLRGRNSTTLEDMHKSAISVEANLLEKRARQRSERRVTIKEEPSTSTSDSKLDSLAREMERMMERLTVSDRNPPRDNPPAPQVQNPNFRRNPPQIRQRDPREQREQRGPDQQIRPPLQENYADEGEEVIEELEDTHINLMGIHDNKAIFLTQEEHELFLLNQIKVSEEAEDAEQQAFENSILEVHRQYNLRSKKTKGSSPKKTIEMKKVTETKNTSKPSARNTSEPSIEKIPEKSTVKAPAKRNLTILKRSSQPEVSPVDPPSISGQKSAVDKPKLMSQGRAPTPFSLEGELAKVKIPIPLSELMNKDVYRS
jgi:hypothetical protein